MTHLLLHPEPAPGDTGLEWILRAADAAEAGVFDALVAPAPGPAVPAEPSTLLAALTPRTTHLGLISQVNTRTSAPYNQARAINTLDNLSVGRAGWWLTDAAQNLSRAAEYTTVLKKLWESWDPDAVVADTGSGVYVDIERLHPIDHAGEHFRVAGPLNLPRSPQLHPPLMAEADFADVSLGPGAPFRELVPDLDDPAALARRLAAGEGFLLHLTAAQTQRFVAEVTPRLRDLGAVPDRYRTSTLRGHLGLATVTGAVS